MKVTVNETDNTQPGAEASIQAQPKNQIIDSRGRVIKLRELDPLQESRVFLIVGPENSGNTQYMQGYAFPAVMVESIDGDHYSIPTSMSQIEGRLMLLGKEGMDAFRLYMLEALREAKHLIDEKASSPIEGAAKN